MIYLDEEQVRSALHWDALIGAMEAALEQFSAGATQQPVRTILEVEAQRRFFGVMPAVAGSLMGLKAVSFYPANQERGIPTHQAMILLFDAQTGEPLAAMDGRLITEMRTAAVSAAVTRRLMPAGSRILALLGSGVQARAHLAVLRHLHHFDEVRVWSPNAEHAQAFATAHAARAADAQKAVRGADVVVVATMAQTPVLQGAWLKPGAHVNAVGAVHPQWREMDDDAMANALIVDSREAALLESGDVIGSRATIAAEAGEIFSGAVTIASGATTVFKSLGLAVEDLAAAKLVYDSLAGPRPR